MKRKNRNVTFISMVSANIIIILLVIFFFATYSRGGTNDISNGEKFDFFEKYGYFGIICNELNQNYDLYTNFIAGKYTNKGNYNLSSSSEYNFIGETESPINYNYTVVNSNTKHYVDDWLEEISKESTDLLQNINLQNKLLNSDNGDRKIIDVSQEEGNFICFNLNEESESVTINNLEIKFRPDQTVVCNVHSNKEVILKNIWCKVLLEELQPYGNFSNKVIFNMPDAQNVQLDSDQLQATIIAPNANVSINKSGDGWLVGNTVNCNDNWNKPSILRNSVPFPTEEPNPSPSEEPSPSPSEEPSPSPSQEPSQSGNGGASQSGNGGASQSGNGGASQSGNGGTSQSGNGGASQSETGDVSQSGGLTSSENEASRKANNGNNEDNVKTGDNIIKFIIILIIVIGIFLVTIFKNKKSNEKSNQELDEKK